MKKSFIAIASLIMTIIMSVACLGGCNLITTDTDKDMQQVVATVSIENGVKHNVYKQDIIVDYLNYGYYYVQNGQMTMEDTIKTIVKSRVNTLLLSQNAMKELNADDTYDKNTSYTNVWKAERYLSDQDIIDAKYGVHKNINELILSFANEEDPLTVKDTVDTTVRTAPTNAQLDEEEPDKEAYLTKEFGFEIESITKRREGFDKFVHYLKINNLLGAGYSSPDITTTDYYKDTLENEKLYMVLQNYREVLSNKERAKITYQDLKDDFTSNLNDQKEWTNAEFVNALSNATASDPVFYGANGKYGYVYNLLLGADDVQTAKINAIKSDNPNITKSEYSVKRNEILATTRVTDLRDSWVVAGYNVTGDFDNNGVSTNVKFGGDYTFTSDFSLPYIGTVTRLTPADKEDAEYRAKSNTMVLADFLKGMDSYMTSGNFNTASTRVTDVKDTYFTKTGNAVLSAGIYGNVADYDAKINELLFAFSTDDGSLNTHKGYVIQPAVDANNSEQFVETFANAGRELLAMGQNGYAVVASDYGYHVMFFSQAFDFNGVIANNLEEYLGAIPDGYNSWEEYYNAMVSDFDEWEDTDNYMYLLFDALTSVKVTNVVNRVEKKAVSHYTYDVEGAVKTYPDTYKDLY